MGGLLKTVAGELVQATSAVQLIDQAYIESAAFKNQVNELLQALLGLAAEPAVVSLAPGAPNGFAGLDAGAEKCRSRVEQ